jgi:alpha-tubulin suppressor-like RCC1 family protein
VPGEESCNGQDDDCDGLVDEGLKKRCWADADGDGYAAMGAAVSESCDACGPMFTAVEPVSGKVDCDDLQPTKSPGATDICGDNIDNDCNGTADDAMNNACGGPCSTQLPGKPGDLCTNGQEGACAKSGFYECQPDKSMTCTAKPVQPGAAEVCGDDSDNDCDGMVNEGCVQNKCKGWTTLANPVDAPCTATVDTCSYSGTYVCANSDATVCGNPPKEDCATPVDDNCDGAVNEGCAVTVTSIAAASGNSCAVLSDGTARCWGNNDDGQVGDGSTVDRNVPTAVAGLTNAVQITIGGRHGCALLRDGTVRCWGDNSYGQLGNNTTVDSLSPVQVQGLSHVVQVSAGEKKTCALYDVGSVSCWGSLGADWQMKLVPSAFSGLVDIAELALENITNGGCARMNSGGVVCWDDQLNSPTPVPGVAGAVSVGASERHGCAVLADGAVKCWNRRGTEGSEVITQAAGVSNAAAVGAGADHACVRLRNGGVYCWGTNYYGYLGTGKNGTSGVVPGLDVAALAVGAFHGCALGKGGVVSCWGLNVAGQVGDGSAVGTPESERWSPVVVINLP